MSTETKPNTQQAANNNQSKAIDETAKKLTAALEQSLDLGSFIAAEPVKVVTEVAAAAPAPAAPATVVEIKQPVAKVEAKAAAKKEIAKKAEAKKPAAKAAEKKVAEKPAAKKIAKPAIKKALKKAAKPAAKATEKQATAATNEAAKTVEKYASALKEAVSADKLQASYAKISDTQQELTKFSKEAGVELKKQATDFAQTVYAQNTQLAKDLLSAKDINQVFEIQSKAAKQGLQQSLNQLLQAQQICAESLSKAFALVSKK